MINERLRPVALLCWLFLGLAPATSSAADDTFEQSIRPIFKAYCFECHGASAKLKGNLDLRLRRSLVKGGKSGAGIVPGDAAKSLLLQRLTAGEMPPTEKKVPRERIAVIERWINAGAPTLHDEPAKLAPGIDITSEERAFWCFQPLRHPAPPHIAGEGRVRTPIDAFLLAKLHQKGLTFNADADRLTLLRRASFDLTGLPPRQEEIDRFMADDGEGAYERALDRLLASPAYGERWARHWLDVAGYADSDGDGAKDTPRPYAWKYRDYVIRALNADKPLDQFIVEQLAGDELAPRPWTNLKSGQIELLTATGFLRMAPDATSSGGGPAEVEQVVVDTLKIVSSSLLGLTVGCAQCHDHRYDPIPQADYYRLRAIFEPALDPAQWRRPAERRISLYTDADRAKAVAIESEAAKMQKAFEEKQHLYVRKAFEAELARFPAEARARLQAAFDCPAEKRSAEQKKLVAVNPKLNIHPGVLYQYNEGAADELKKLQAQVSAKRARKPAEDFLAVLTETAGRLPPTKVFHRGDYRQPLEAVQPGDLTIAAPAGQRFDIPSKDPRLPSSGRRLAFARHLTSGDHPLLGRVLANRIWLNHFGRGLVDTPGDFGVLGQRPAHPELLDWLASELPRQGWSLKRMHRLIMTSTAYRQSSRRDAAKDAVDAGDDLYGRYPLHRLEAEVLRDRMLDVAGRLDLKPFGPAVAVTLDAVGQVGTPDDQPRRSIYLMCRRSQPVAFLSAFDGPAGELNCPRRNSSIAAPQALMLLNGDFTLKQAGNVARRILNETPGASRPERVTHAWKIVYQRPATPEELDLACRFLDRQIKRPGASGQADRELAALTNLCQQLLASNEFLYVD